MEGYLETDSMEPRHAFLSVSRPITPSCQLTWCNWLTFFVEDEATIGLPSYQRCPQIPRTPWRWKFAYSCYLLSNNESKMSMPRMANMLPSLL